MDIPNETHRFEDSNAALMSEKKCDICLSLSNIPLDKCIIFYNIFTHWQTSSLFPSLDNCAWSSNELELEGVSAGRGASLIFPNSGRSMSSFVRNIHTRSQSGCTSVHSHQRQTSVHFPPHPGQTFPSFFLNPSHSDLDKMKTQNSFTLHFSDC